MSVLAWIVGWILLTAALAGMLRTAWPALPLWVVPAASSGLAALVVGGAEDLMRLARYGARQLIQRGKESQKQ